MEPPRRRLTRQSCLGQGEGQDTSPQRSRPPPHDARSRYRPEAAARGRGFPVPQTRGWPSREGEAGLCGGPLGSPHSPALTGMDLQAALSTGDRSSPKAVRLSVPSTQKPSHLGLLADSTDTARLPSSLSPSSHCPWLALLRPRGPPHGSSQTPGMVLPRGLCMCRSHCLGRSDLCSHNQQPPGLPCSVCPRGPDHHLMPCYLCIYVERSPHL